MARQYSPTQFFRLVPNTLLERYFKEKRKVLHEINFGQLKEAEVEPIFQAFLNLPPEQQAEMEAELQDIDTMACQGGVTTLTDEAALNNTAKRQGFLKRGIFGANCIYYISKIKMYIVSSSHTHPSHSFRPDPLG